MKLNSVLYLSLKIVLTTCKFFRNREINTSLSLIQEAPNSGAPPGGYTSSVKFGTMHQNFPQGR